jgi:hypothetical protein
MQEELNTSKVISSHHQGHNCINSQLMHEGFQLYDRLQPVQDLGPSIISSWTQFLRSKVSLDRMDDFLRNVSIVLNLLQYPDGGTD